MVTVRNGYSKDSGIMCNKTECVMSARSGLFKFR